MYNKKLTFSKDGKFKIMQIADVQESTTVSADTIKLISLAVQEEKPDLVVFTGDQLYGLLPVFRMGNPYVNVKQTLSDIVGPLEYHNIPFAVTFGNHDCQTGVSNKEQADIYTSFSQYVGGNYRNEEDKGTYTVPIYSEDGEEILFNLYLIDSNGQSITGEYLPVSEEQIEWYKKERDALFEKTGRYIPSVVFQHIPVPEFFDVIKKVDKGTKGSVEAFRTHKNEFYTLPEEIIINGGFMYESPAIPDKNSGEFEALKEKGDVLSIFVGHDHINSFTAKLDGIDLVYTQGTGFNVYGPGRNRGVRIIELDKNDLTKVSSRTVTFGSLTNDKISAPVKEFVLTHIPSSMEQVKRIALWGSVAGIGALAIGAALYKKLKK